MNDEDSVLEELEASEDYLSDLEEDSGSKDEEEIEEALEEIEETLEELDDLLEDESEETIEEVISEVEELVEEYVIEYDEDGDPIIPEREQDWGENVFVIQGKTAERILNDAGARGQNIHSRIALMGHHRQNRFLAYLAARMLTESTEDSLGGILFVPMELGDYEPLVENLNKLDDAPEGFVAFQAK